MSDTTVEIRFADFLKQNTPPNGDAWERCFVRPALHEARHERRVSVQRLVEQTRAQDHVNWKGQEVKINNSFSPLIARKLISDHPELRGYIELRRSNYDHLLATEG